MKYYIDTNIWIDILEDRKGYNGEPLGEYGASLVQKIVFEKSTIIISDLLSIELSRYPAENIRGLFTPLQKRLKHIYSTKVETREALQISKKHHVPLADAIHAVLARNSGALLVTRDKHFKRLQEVTPHFKPEELC